MSIMLREKDVDLRYRYRTASAALRWLPRVSLPSGRARSGFLLLTPLTPHSILEPSSTSIAMTNQPELKDASAVPSSIYWSGVASGLISRVSVHKSNGLF